MSESNRSNTAVVLNAFNQSAAPAHAGPVLDTVVRAHRGLLVQTAEQLLERVWDEQTDPFTNVVRMTIMTLRRKLGDPPIVETVIGVGYRMA